MGTRNGAYNADFPSGTTVRVAPLSVLEEFAANWHSHHPLSAEQLVCAGSVAEVRTVGYYHGGDELYELDGLPGLWHEACLEPLLEGSPMAEAAADRQSRVLRAALDGDASRLREAIASGDDVNAWDEHGLTPLLSAVFIGNLEAVRLLLAAGADPNRAQRDDPTATPLWHARDDFGLYQVADLLLQAGANETTPSFDEAVQRLRAFIGPEGWPEAIIWRHPDDILPFPGPIDIVRARADARADAWARRFYDEGARAGVGVSLHAACVIRGRTCATIFWTRDERTAEQMMLPRSGLKLSYSMSRLEARSHGAIRWWFERRALARFHASLRP